ncbi:MAG: hypothetical protein ABIB71_00180 [Candidatus Woesearchaeota archaeon]
MDKRAQAVVTDLFIAIAIFTIVIAILITAYSSYYRRLDDQSHYNDMILSTYYISEALIDSPGYPDNWNLTNVSAVGLAGDYRILSSEKIHNFANLSYNVSKRLLGLGDKEFFFQIRGLNGLLLAEHGISPVEDKNCSAYQSVSAERIAYWENQKVVVSMMVWDDRCEREGGTGRIIAGEPEQYMGVPEAAFEEDNNPTWAGQVQVENDFVYARSQDEGLIMPDYVQFNFPNLGITSSRRIVDVTLRIRHREESAGGSFPAGESSRRMIQCWNGVWNDTATYTISASNSTWAYEETDLSGCITTVNLANNINVRMTFDPAFDSGGFQDIDYAQVVVDTI